MKSASTKSQSVKSAPGIRDATIFVVDDDVGTLCLCVNVLNRLGYKNIHTLNDPVDVIDRVAKLRPDLLLLDLFMPRLDGFEVLARLRQTGSPCDDFPIIVVSGESTLEKKRRVLTAGAADFLCKPFDSTELNVRVTSVLQERFLQRQIQAQNEFLENRVAERTRELEVALVELKAMQHQIVQQERLRALGEMASGIAHDFNNTLMCVIGYSEILIEDPTQLADVNKVLEYLKFINTAGRDASEVVGAFARVLSAARRERRLLRNRPKQGSRRGGSAYSTEMARPSPRSRPRYRDSTRSLENPGDRRQRQSTARSHDKPDF